MSFVLIDLDGSTLDEFASANALRGFLRKAVGHEPTYADDLAVLRYANGRRVGRPAPAREFVSDPTQLVVRSAMINDVIEVVVPAEARHEPTQLFFVSPAIDHSYAEVGLAGRGDVPRRPGVMSLALAS